MEISRSQQLAIEHFTGPAMVLAGPGSGKTTVITHRVRHLIRYFHVDPASILVITFTRAAAAQMKRRFADLDGIREEAARQVTFGTFHSVYLRILKEERGYPAIHILPEAEKTRIITGLLREQLPGAAVPSGDLARKLLAGISRVKNDPGEAAGCHLALFPAGVFSDIYRSYQRTLSERGLIDYDDILLLANSLLKKRTDTLARWQDRFRFILIDEFQDINEVQYDTISMLAARDRNLFAVGDDDQSIYGFRGAAVRFMMDFEKKWPAAAIFRLQDNYRSSRGIVEAAGAVIAANRHRREKNMRAVHAKEGRKSVFLHACPDVMDECEEMIRGVRQAVRSGRELHQIAVLTRTVSGGRYAGMKLLQAGIPVRFSYEMQDLFSHWAARDILSYIRLGMGGRDRGDFLRIMNRPYRGLTRACLDSPRVSFDRLRLVYREDPFVTGQLMKLERDLALIGAMKPYAAVNYVRLGTGYGKYLETCAEQFEEGGDEPAEIAELVQADAAAFETLREWTAHAAGRRERQRETQNPGKREDPEEAGRDAVQFMTLHGAKGLEFDEVYLPDLVQGTLPYRQSLRSPEAVEEERRLMYVGMTRARQVLHLMWTKRRFGRDAKTSVFLAPLLKKQ